MQFFRFWARTSTSIPERDFPISCLGFSNQSVDDARRVANERMRRTADALAKGLKLDAYDYADGPMREEIIEHLQFNGETAALISRNSYGCLVINSPSVFFGDIDIWRRTVGWKPFGWIPLGWLFGTEVLEPTDESLTGQIAEMCQRDASLGFRLYRTAGGYRLVETSRTYEPDGRAANQLFETFSCDFLYRRLCKSQSCFRARLTPKPWRLELQTPPVRFPYLDPQEQQQFRRWLDSYERIAGRYATCQLIGNYGNQSVDPLVDRVIQVHDAVATNADQPLA